MLRVGLAGAFSCYVVARPAFMGLGGNFPIFAFLGIPAFLLVICFTFMWGMIRFFKSRLARRAGMRVSPSSS